ncbi:MAG: hypothetical protein RLZ56_1255 [Bacteroidota bacterium]
MRINLINTYLYKIFYTDTMKARLNITIETSLLNEVKKLAAKKNISVSELVENYFMSITKPKRKLLTEILDQLPKVKVAENKKLSELYYEEKMKDYKNGK